MLFATQTFLVAGLSRSGIAAAEYLVSRGARVYVYDDVEDDTVRSAAQGLSEIGCMIVSKEDLAAK